MARRPAPAPAPARKPRRFLLKGLVALALLAALALAMLPTILGTRPARALVLGRVNARLAPGSVKLEGLSASWRGPIELTGVSLVDPKGKTVLAAKTVRLERGLLDLMAGRPDHGTVTVEGGLVDVERRADGSVDLLEALGHAPGPKGAAPAHDGPIPKGDAPKPAYDPTSVLLVLKDCRLKLASPELGEPIAADKVEGTLTVAPGKPIGLDVALADGDRSLAFHGKVDHRGAGPSAGDLELTVVGKDWPINVKGRGASARGRFDGTLTATRAAGAWSARGTAALVDFEASGPGLAGDEPKFGRVDLVGDVAQTPIGWDILRLDATSAVGHVHADGVVPPAEGSEAQLRAVVDLAALTRLLPATTRLRDGLVIARGTAEARVDLATKGGVERATLVATVANLAATEGPRTITLREVPRITASASRAAGRLTIERAEIRAAGVNVAGSGALDSGVSLKGTIDLAALRAQLADLLDLGGVAFSGRARLAADYRLGGESSYKARLAADCRGLDLVGLTAEPIRRDLDRLDVTATGPRSPTGTPVGWASARVDLKAGDIALDLQATHGPGDALALDALVAGEVASPTPGRAVARASVRRSGPVYDFEDLHVGLVAANPAGSVTVSARGRVDLQSGEADFNAILGGLAGPIGLGGDGIRISGLGRAGKPIQFVGGLVGDLAMLDRLDAAWTGSTPKGLAGVWAFKGTGSRSADGHVEFDGHVNLSELAGAAAGMEAKGSYRPDVDRLDLVKFDASTGYGKANIAGHVDAVKGRRVADLAGTIDPNWDTIGPILAKSVGPKAYAQARTRPFRLAGPLAAESKAALVAGLDGEFGLDVGSAGAEGIEVGKMAVVLKLGGGKAQFDPIATSINGAPMLIQGGLDFDEAGGIWLRLDASRIDGAPINDAVSDALLAYVAPVLARASAVNGKLTVVLSDKGAYIPLTATGSMKADGIISFDSLRFIPGPMVNQVFGMVGQKVPNMTITQPIRLAVADGRVSQSGLSVAIPGGASVAFDGSVGFDRTVSARATVPITAAMVGGDPKLDKLLAGSKVVVPIGGTLSRPTIDRRGLDAALRDAAKSAIGKNLEGEAGRLLDRVAGPAGKGATPPVRDPIGGALEGLGRDLIAPKRP